MTSLARSLRLLIVLAAFAGNAHATFHLWQITQLYSNADGTVQFIELTALASGQQFLAGHTVMSSQGSTSHTYTFDRNLDGDTAVVMPGDSYYGGGATSFKSLLLGTQGFANLGIVAPDFVIPNGFLFTANGRVDWGGGFDVLTYASLPTDGRNAFFRSGAIAANMAQNFAGVMASVVPAAAAINVQGLWWRAPASSENGWGLNLAQQGKILFTTWFTYDTDGSGLWLTATLDPMGNNAYTGQLYRTTGPSFDSVPFDPKKVVATPVGTATFSFTDPDTGSFTYTVNGISQTKPIVRQIFASPVPTCIVGGAQGTAVNFQDLWYRSPAESEAGWGINLTHQGDIIFATWFTYDASGKGMWLVTTNPKTAPNTYSGDLFRTTGSVFSAYDASKFVANKVGTSTFTFSDAGNGVFSYTVNGVTQSKPIMREVFSNPTSVCK